MPPGRIARAAVGECAMEGGGESAGERKLDDAASIVWSGREFLRRISGLDGDDKPVMFDVDALFSSFGLKLKIVSHKSSKHLNSISSTGESLDVICRDAFVGDAGRSPSLVMDAARPSLSCCNKNSREQRPFVGCVGCAIIMQFGGHSCQFAKPFILNGSLDTNNDCVAKIFFFKIA